MNSETPTNAQSSATKTWDAALYDGKHSFVWKYGAGVIELLAPQPGERILDLGCGTGHLTAQIAAAGAEVVGIDKSPDMIDEARKSYPTLRFEVADGADFAFDAPFDAIFSNAALHWMTEPERVVVCMARALKTGGRLVAEFGGKHCMRPVIEAVQQALGETDPSARGTPPFWYFPSIGEYAPLLERHGLAVSTALLFDRPTPLEGGEEGLRVWLKMFANLLFDGMTEERQREMFARVEAQLRPTYFRDGAWIAPYTRLRIAATKESAGA
jgi:trans-aconitate 2-methyltransferase